MPLVVENVPLTTLIQEFESNEVRKPYTVIARHDFPLHAAEIGGLQNGPDIQPRQYTVAVADTAQDFLAITELQRSVFGYPDREIYRAATLRIIADGGGQILLARDSQGEPVGFSIALLAHHPASGNLSLHLDLLGVVDRLQGNGIGHQLLLSQRDLALSANRPIRKITLTFDPMETPNANLYIAKLGGTVSEFVPDCYGNLEGSLSSGLPTHRFEVDWNLNVEVPGRRAFPGDALLLPTYGQATIRSYDVRLDGRAVVVPLPLDFQRIKTTAIESARSQQQYFCVLAHSLIRRHGYTVTNFRVDSASQMGQYLFERR